MLILFGCWMVLMDSSIFIPRIQDMFVILRADGLFWTVPWYVYANDIGIRRGAGLCWMVTGVTESVSLSKEHLDRIPQYFTISHITR